MELHATLWGSGQEHAALLFPECLRAVRGVGCSVLCANGIGVSCVPHWTQAGKCSLSRDRWGFQDPALVRDWTLLQCYYWASYKITGLFAVIWGSNSAPYKWQDFILFLVLTSISGSKGTWAQLMALSWVLWVSCLLCGGFPIACKWWIDVGRSCLLGKSSQACASFLPWNRKRCSFSGTQCCCLLQSVGMKDWWNR